MKAIAKTITLEDFLELSETKPASEYVAGEITVKPMPQGEHSRLQSKLCNEINRVSESKQVAYAFTELRCTFGGKSIVPDIAVFEWQRIPRLASGRIANRFETYPDWAIEILSPNQQQTRALSNLLHCVAYGTRLGWLIYPEENQVLIIDPEAKVQLRSQDDRLPVLSEIELQLTVNELFSWLVF